MKRDRDPHPRPRAGLPGRTRRGDLVRQELQLASTELQSALDAGDLKTAREHVTLARRFVLAAAEKLRRLT